MRQALKLLTLLAISMAILAVPIAVQNAHALTGCQDNGNQCYLTAQTTVPSSDATIHVTVDASPTQYALPYTFSFNNGTTHTVTVVDTSVKGTSGTRYVFKQWTQCGINAGSGSSQTMTTPFMIANYTSICPSPGAIGPYVFVAQFTAYPPVGCITNCLLDVKTSVTNNDANVVAKISVTAPCPCTTNFYQLPLASPLSYSNGTTISLQILNSTAFTGSSGARYTWTQWTQGSNTNAATTISVLMIANYTTSGAGPYNAQFDKQYKINIIFTDGSNPPASASSPTSLTLSSSSGIVTLTSYSNVWLDGVVWTTTDATWQGITGSVSPQTIDLSGAPITTATVQLKAYPETIHVVDRSNNPVPSVQITVIFSNSTSRQFTTNSQGNVVLGDLPAGSYTAHLFYQNQDMGRWTADASQTSTNTIQIPIGSSPQQQQVSAIVLLTIFGLVFFLILLAVKVRKPPPPPTIGAAEPTSTSSNE